MPKLVFRVNADTSPVTKFRNEIESVEKTMIRIKSENFSFDHWIREFERLKNELEKRKIQISELKKEISSINYYTKPNVVSSLEKEYAQAKKEQESLVNETMNLSNKFGNAYDDLVETLGKAQKVTDSVTVKLIEQKNVVANLQSEVRLLNAEYRNAGKDKKADILAQKTSKQKELEQERVTLNDLKATQERAKLSVKGLADETRNYEKVVGRVSGAQAEAALVSSRFEKSLLSIGGLATLQKFASDVIRVRGQFQQLEVAFTTLLQSKEKADALMGQMVETAAKTPFNLTELATGAKQLVAYGFASEGINDTLIRLGNIAAGLGLPLERLTYLYGTTMTQGRLYARDLMQFTTSGIPMLQGLADMYGVSTEKVNEMVTAGKIGFPEVQKVIESMTNEGGKFYNLMEEQSKTITGKISNLGDAWDSMLNQVGQSQEGVINGSIDMAKYLVENYEEVGRVLLGLVATYGAYKAATIAYYAISKTYAIYDIATKELQFAATMKNIVATQALSVQQAILNKTMLANPYVLVATLVVGAATAMWIMADNTSTAERAQKRFNEKQEEAQKIEQEHKRKIDELINSSRDIALADLQRGQSLAELRKEYPKIFAEYDVETIKLADILKLKQKIAEEDEKRAGEKLSTEFSDTEAEIQYYENLLKSLSGKQGVDGYVKKLKELRADRDIMLQERGKGVSEQFILSLKDIDISQFDRYISELEKRIKGVGGEGKVKIKLPIDARGTLSDEAIYDVKDIKTLIDTTKTAKKAKESAFNAEKKPASEWLSSYKKAYEDAEKAYNDFLKSKQVMSDTDRDKELERLKGLRDTAKKTYEDKGGSTSSDNKQERKEESAAEKLRKEQEKYALLLDKQKREQERMKTDSQHELEQIEINGLEEGSEKVLRQRQLNHAKELEAIKREVEDKKLKAIEEARSAFEANPDNKKKVFNAEDFIKSEPVKKQFATFDNVAEAKTNTENTKYNRGDDLKGLLDEYQDYTDKRLAIETKFNNDLATLNEQRETAVKNGDTKQVEQIDRAKAQATTDKGKALIGLDYEQLKQSPEYVRAFENLKETSSETLNSLLSQLENAKTAAAEVLSPDQLREYTTTIQDIMNELDERNPFQALTDKKEELAAAEEELARAQIELENARQTADAVKGGAKIENGVKSSTLNQKTGKIDSTKAYLSEAQALENVKEKTENYNKSKDNAVKASSKVRKSEKEVRDVIDDLSKSISDVGNSIGGPAGEIISLIGDIGSFAMMAMSGVETASKTTSTAIQTVEKASVILMIISAAIQIATKMLDLFGGDDTTEKYESTKEAYESYINILDQVIDKQLEMAESLSGASAQAAYDKAIELVKTQSEAARVLGKQYLNSGASWKTHSKGYEEVEDMSYEGWADAAKALGMSVDQIKNTLGGRMDGLFDLTDEQLAKLQGEAHIFWAQLDDDTQDYANQIAEGVDKVAEVIEQRMADVTLIDVDTLRSDFHDLLTDMDADTADFADNFEEYMKNAILNSMLKEQYMGRLTEWRKKFYAAMGDGVTEEEYNELKSEGQQISDEMKAERDKMAEMYGWTSGESTSQDSTSGGFETMSQDTGEELNGRFTALQISGEEIKNQNILQSESLNLLNFKADALLTVNTEVRNIADETRTILANSYLELVQISENTGESAKHLKDIKTDIAEVKRNTSRI